MTKFKKVKRHGRVNKIPIGHSVLKCEDKLEHLAQQVSTACGLDITIPHRKREYVYMRAIFYRLAVELTKFSYEVIGRYCQKDHASVTHGMQVKWPEIETYRPDLVDIYEQIVLDLDDSDFTDLKVLRMKESVSELEQTLINIKKEIGKDYFSMQQKLVNIRKAAYNEELN